MYDHIVIDLYIYFAGHITKINNFTLDWPLA
jgi:hypothetical protein